MPHACISGATGRKFSSLDRQFRWRNESCKQHPYTRQPCEDFEFIRRGKLVGWSAGRLTAGTWLRAIPRAWPGACGRIVASSAAL
eukprot:303980-Chlamydomonas_euryale.AAC.3